MERPEFNKLLVRLSAIAENSDLENQENVYLELFSYIDHSQDFLLWPEQAQVAVLTCVKSFLKDESSAIKGLNSERLKSLSVLSGLQPGSTAKQDKVSHEAMKCIANALLLAQKLRLDFSKLDAFFIIFERLALKGSIELSTDTQFLYSRILFLSTVDPSHNLIILIHEYNVASAISMVLKSLSLAQDNNQIIYSQTMIAVDLLKFIFNLIVNYPKAYFSIPQYHELLSETSLEESKLVEDPNHFIIEYFKDILVPVIHITLLAMDLGSESLFLNCTQILFNFSPENFCGEFPSESERLGRYLIDMIIAPAREAQYSAESAASYERTSPCVLLLASLCRFHLSVKKMSCSRLLPSDEDRENRIGEGSSPSSRLVSVLTAGSLGGLKDALGELFFILCDEDVDEIVKKLGYGNVAGFLVNRHMGNIPSAPRKDTSNPKSKKFINPITGQFREREASNPAEEMTEEEKLREAEKLFVLFERMKKNPAIQIRNPVEEALHSGKLELIPSDEDSD